MLFVMLPLSSFMFFRFLAQVAFCYMLFSFLLCLSHFTRRTFVVIVVCVSNCVASSKADTRVQKVIETMNDMLQKGKDGKLFSCSVNGSSLKAIAQVHPLGSRFD